MSTSDVLPESQKLTIDNYQTWKTRCRLLLMKENTWKYVDAAVNNRPVINEPEETARGRARALYSITMSCCESIFNELSDISDPRTAWNTLKERFEKTNNSSRLMLLDRLNSIRLPEGGSINECIQKIQETKLQLKGVGHSISENDLVARMLNTIPPSYEAVYNQVSTLSEMPTLETLTTMLLQHAQLGNRATMHHTEALAARFQRPAYVSNGQQSFRLYYPSEPRHPAGNSYLNTTASSISFDCMRF